MGGLIKLAQVKMQHENPGTKSIASLSILPFCVDLSTTNDHRSQVYSKRDQIGSFVFFFTGDNLFPCTV